MEAHMKFVIFAIFLSFNLFAAVSCNCILQNQNNPSDKIDLNKDVTGKLLNTDSKGTTLTWPQSQITNVVVLNNNKNANYLQPSLNDKNFTLTVQEDFKNYEENEVENPMQIKIQFTCADKSTVNVTFAITIEETEKRQPVFLSHSNSIAVTYPAPKNETVAIFPIKYISLYADKAKPLTLTVKDNKNNEYAKNFNVFVHQHLNEPKRFDAHLNVGDGQIDYFDDIELTLEAQGSYNPNATSFTFNLTVDKQQSTVLFEENIYKADLSDQTHDNMKEIEVTFQKEIKMIRGSSNVNLKLISTSEPKLDAYTKLKYLKEGEKTISGLVIQPNLQDEVIKQINSVGSLVNFRLVAQGVNEQAIGFTTIQVILGQFKDNTPADDNVAEASSAWSVIWKILLALIIIGILGGIGYFLYKRYYRAY